MYLAQKTASTSRQTDCYVIKILDLGGGKLITNANATDDMLCIYSGNVFMFPDHNSMITHYFNICFV